MKRSLTTLLIMGALLLTGCATEVNKAPTDGEVNKVIQEAINDVNNAVQTDEEGTTSAIGKADNEEEKHSEAEMHKPSSTERHEDIFSKYEIVVPVFPAESEVVKTDNAVATTFIMDDFAMSTQYIWEDPAVAPVVCIAALNPLDSGKTLEEMITASGYEGSVDDFIDRGGVYFANSPQGLDNLPVDPSLEGVYEVNQMVVGAMEGFANLVESETTTEGNSYINGIVTDAIEGEVDVDGILSDFGF